MLELIAQGTTLDTRWRRPLPDQTVEIGRTTPTYRVPWDNQISRRHVRLIPVGDQVQVEKIAAASNPVFYNGREEDSFKMNRGEHFVIGKTTFTLAADRAFVSLDVPDPVRQRNYSSAYLRQVAYQDADRRIDIINRIPEVISSAVNVEDLLIRMINMLMAGIPPASTIGIVQLETVVDRRSQHNPDASEGSKPHDSIQIIQWDRRGVGSGDFQPSETLIRQAIEKKETILNIWNQSKRSSLQYTFDYENDWAFVCPINGEASPGWGIYVAGANLADDVAGLTESNESQLQDDIKFCELVGSTLKNLLLVKLLERQQSSLRTFFSPIVMDALAGRDPEEVLTPRKCHVSVLFCDLRGFSQTSERMADKLLELLARVSDSLGIMTRRILAHGGVIGDFHGDSAMGFWGWPLEPEQVADNAVSAISAALEIQDEVTSTLRTNPNLQNFQIGLGIASGEAVAGKIGTQDQVKVTVFGPVVNLASRLEGMTRWLDASILTDAETIRHLEFGLEPAARPAIEHLGKYQPFGMKSSLDVFRVLRKGQVAIEDAQFFAKALQHFQEGDWQLAIADFERIGNAHPARELITRFMARHHNEPPAEFEGVIQMQAK